MRSSLSLLASAALILSSCTTPAGRAAKKDVVAISKNNVAINTSVTKAQAAAAAAQTSAAAAQTSATKTQQTLQSALQQAEQIDYKDRVLLGE